MAHSNVIKGASEWWTDDSTMVNLMKELLNKFTEWDFDGVITM
jgi:hypothetical protein